MQDVLEGIENSIYLSGGLDKDLNKIDLIKK